MDGIVTSRLSFIVLGWVNGVLGIRKRIFFLSSSVFLERRLERDAFSV